MAPKRKPKTKAAQNGDIESATTSEVDVEVPMKKRGTTKEVKKVEQESSPDRVPPKKASKRGRQTEKAQEKHVESETDAEDNEVVPTKKTRTVRNRKKDEEEEPEAKGKASKTKKANPKDEEKEPKSSKVANKPKKANKKDEVDEPKLKGKTSKAKKATEKAETKAPLNATSTKWETIDFACDKKNSQGQLPNLKITSWNVDGLRAWLKKDGFNILSHDTPDIFCLQETKCSEGKLPDEVKDIDDYHIYWCTSKKEGYAGVGVYSKVEPLDVAYGIGEEDHDEEGRCLTLEYNDFYLVNVYVPNAGRGLVTLPKRLEWNEDFKTYIKELDEKKPVIICGDMNVAHNEIDLTNPKPNKKNAGFTQEERDGLTDFLENGYKDSFRELYPDKTDAYTFWSYMSQARSKNIGWRLDYFILSNRIMEKVCDNVIRSEVFGSDHCPITLFINI